MRPVQGRRMIAHVGGHLQPAGAGEVRAGVRAPVAHEGRDLRLEARPRRVRDVVVRRSCALLPLSQQRVDLGVDLLVGEALQLDAFDGQVATQVPQPWQTPGLTSATTLHDVALPVADRPCGARSRRRGRRARSGSSRRTGALRRPRPPSGSRSSSSLLNRPSTLAAAPLAMATDSGMSRGAWQAPARNTPAVLVSTGRSLGCASLKKPWAS